MESPTTPKPARRKTYAYLDLEFLLQEAPGLLGERSNMGGFISALSSGGPGQSVASSDDHHEHQINRLEWVGKARRLLRTWQCLDRHTQVVLTAYYTPRVRWPQGYAALIGDDLASVALAFPPDGDGHALSEACRHATKKAHEQLIRRAKQEAQEHVQNAHEEWDRIRRLVDPTEPKDVKAKAKAEEERELAA